MALIQCKNCGKEISDRAPKCPNCGIDLIDISTQSECYVCEECGTPLLPGSDTCPNCGCPIPAKAEETPQKVAVTSVDLPKMKQSSKKKIIAAVCVMIAAIALFMIGKQVYDNQQAEEAKRIAEEVAAEYSSNLHSACILMLTGAGDAESAGNLIKQVWYNSIYKEKDSKTDKYTRPNGYFVGDFNTALGNLFADSSFTVKIQSIKSNQNLVASLMKELKNPPEGYEEAYAAIKDLYNAYTTFTNMVVDPSGSLQTFSTNFNNADSDVLNKYNAMKMYLD